MLLADKNIIVTGANRGIGKACIEVMAQNGANIWACARTQNDEFEAFLETTAKENNVTITPIYFDLSDDEAMKIAVKQIKSEKKSVDGLVNNAGAIFVSLFSMTSMNKMQEMFDINYFGQMKFTQHIVKMMMRQRSGSIVNISSSAAIEGNEGRSAYAGAKSALITTSKVMARELGSIGIRVNAVAPGLTQTEMMESSTPQDALEETVNCLSLKRVGEPKEIANSIMFLLSDLSSYMTGQTISVDGGM
jgi:3-oxoacyl-[acyl-carrier protein] reductase